MLWRIALVVSLASLPIQAQDADLILHHGKIAAVDRPFHIHDALAVRDGKIAAVGTNDDVLKLKGPKTEIIDLGGKLVLPGLIDSHVHPNGACMTEFQRPLPDFETIEDVLNYIRAQAKIQPKGTWISLSQIFITRLKEQRYPTKAELDIAAPKHPVVYSTGPDASLNSLALKLSHIDRDFKVTDGGPGHAEKDPKTGEPTGILRSCTRFVKSQPYGKEPTEADRTERLVELLKDYTSVGLTGIIDRDAAPSHIDRYRKLFDAGKLPLRVAISHSVGTNVPTEQIQQAIQNVARNPLCQGGPMLRIVGVKTYLDGGMLTGSAYMRQPWGVSRIYAIDDPTYQGLRFIPKDKLRAIVKTTVENGLQFTAHSVGDGAVHALLEAYDDVNKTVPIRKTRPCITHSNFMSAEAIRKMVELGVAVDIQPAWLYLDTHTLVKQFGYDRMRYFQPLQSIFKAGGIAGGGSDHMQKIGSFRSTNPYNPFLGMWTEITRKAKWYDGQLHPEEALTREQAIRFYTINNAYLMFLDDQTGSLEPNKRADFIVLDTDLLTCDVDAIPKTRVLRAYVDGKLVHQAK
jgi:predicted amidohydrolase YtcJ